MRIHQPPPIGLSRWQWPHRRLALNYGYIAYTRSLLLINRRGRSYHARGRGWLHRYLRRTNCAVSIKRPQKRPNTPANRDQNRQSRDPKKPASKVSIRARFD